MLNSQHSAAVSRQQSVGYELYADTVNKTDRLYTVQQTVGQRSNRIESITGSTYWLVICNWAKFDLLLNTPPFFCMDGRESQVYTRYSCLNVIPYIQTTCKLYGIIGHWRRRIRVVETSMSKNKPIQHVAYKSVCLINLADISQHTQ